MTKLQVVEQIYGQIHEHMRESHRKRDQIVAFYIALLAGVFAGWSNLRPFLVPVLGVVFLVGCLAFFILLQYRRWHIKYNNALVVFQYLMSSEQRVDINLCNQLWRELNDIRKRWGLIKPGLGVENATNVSFTVLVAIPVHFLIQHLNIGFYVPIQLGGELMALVGNVLLVVGVGLILSAWILPSSQVLERNDWMFRWLRSVEPTGRESREEALR